jgi:hypothetical protein
MLGDAKPLMQKLKKDCRIRKVPRPYLLDFRELALTRLFASLSDVLT